jgi:hypothetical protein
VGVSIDFSSSQAISKRKTGFERLSELLSSWQKTKKTHHYKASDCGFDFFLQKNVAEPREFYMTAQKAGVKKDDFIRVHGTLDSPQSASYTVLDIDVYADQPDIWVAKLALLSND